VSRTTPQRSDSGRAPRDGHCAVSCLAGSGVRPGQAARYQAFRLRNRYMPPAIATAA
jgi:hypothetical protein